MGELTGNALIVAGMETWVGGQERRGEERRGEEKRTWDGQLKLGEMAGRRGVSCHL
jgi:hypothetical protein